MGSTSTTSRRGSLSSSTRTSTSSRRSRSTAPRAGSGRASCATATARKNPRSWLMRLPHADRGRLADRAAARGEHRADGARGDGGRARRHSVAAHELVRRGARAADRGRGRIALRTQQVIAHETGVVNTLDPLGGSYYVEDTDQPARGGGLRLLRPDREARRCHPGDQGELLPARDRRCLVPLPARGRAEAADHRRRQPLRARGRTGDRDPADRPDAGGQADRARPGPARDGVTRPPSRRLSRG